jgi:hypothetical protein
MLIHTHIEDVCCFMLLISYHFTGEIVLTMKLLEICTTYKNSSDNKLSHE